MTVGKDLFVCYRTADSEDQARRIADLLKEEFGEKVVFFAPWIPLGDNWRTEVQQALSHCSILVALIGRKWETATSTEGQASLQDAEDVLRGEIRTALERKIRVIPILIEGAGVPDDLPSDIRELVDRQALKVPADLQREDCVDLFAAVRRELFRIRAWRRVLLISLAVSIAAAWTGLFEAIGLDTSAAMYVVAIGDTIAGDGSADPVAVVGLREPIGNLAEARRKHARVIRLLAEKSGARVLAVDFIFETENDSTRAADEELAAAIAEAGSRGIKVVLAFSDAEGNEPKLARRIRGAADRTAIASAGHQVDLAYVIPLAVEPPRSDTSWFSLAVHAVACARDLVPTVEWDAEEVVLKGASGTIRAPFFRTERVDKTQSGCPAIRANSRVGSAALHSRPNAWHEDESRHLTYAQVEEGGLSPGEIAVLKDRIVVLGGEIGTNDMWTVRTAGGGERQYGCRLHADAIRSILGEKEVLRASFWVQSAATLFMVIAACALAVYARGAVVALAAGGGLLVVYLFLAVYAYVEHATLLSILYPVAASLMSFGGARWVRTRYAARRS